MAIYILKVWVNDGPGGLAIDELIEAADTASAIEAARKYPVPLWMGLATKAELRDNFSFVVWSLPADA